MKKTIELIGIIVFIAVIGFSLAVCSNSSNSDPGPLDGTWSDGTNYRLIFSGSTYKCQYNDLDWKTIEKGTFKLNEEGQPEITFHQTDAWDDGSGKLVQNKVNYNSQEITITSEYIFISGDHFDGQWDKQ